MEAITHYCPNCGGPLTFNPEDQKFHCPFCLSVFTPDELFQREKEEKDAEEKVDTQEVTEKTAEKTVDDATGNLELFLCPSCGAEIVTDATTAATYCYFCHNPVILKERLSGKFLPEQVVPFSIPKEKAMDKFLQWTKKKAFVPKDFFNKDQIEKLTGVYFPYWNVNADTTVNYEGAGTTLRVWVIDELEYTETKQYHVTRQGKIHFNNLLKPALDKNLRQAMVTSIQPFDLSLGVPFKDAYLAGFQGEKRDVEYDALKDAVHNEIKNYSETLLKESASGYNTLSTTRIEATVEAEENHYLLLPVWLLTYHDKSKNQFYYYAMNGQTGKTAGKLPINYLKLSLVTGEIFSVLFAIFLLVGYFI